MKIKHSKSVFIKAATSSWTRMSDRGPTRVEKQWWGEGGHDACEYYIIKDNQRHTIVVNLTVRGPTLYVRIWRP